MREANDKQETNSHVAKDYFILNTGCSCRCVGDCPIFRSSPRRTWRPWRSWQPRQRACCPRSSRRWPFPCPRLRLLRQRVLLLGKKTIPAALLTNRQSSYRGLIGSTQARTQSCPNSGRPAPMDVSFVENGAFLLTGHFCNSLHLPALGYGAIG
jgi:hypothetical protein